MEIKIEEKFESLKISKICKKELRKAHMLAIVIIILLYGYFVYEDPRNYPMLIIFLSPLAWIIFVIICRPYKYEVIYIDYEKIRFSSSYTEKNAETAMTSFFLIKNLKEFYIKEYYETPPRNIFKFENTKNIPHYKVHFTFLGEKDYACWGYEVPINEAERVIRRINNFLEKQNYLHIKKLI